jgi:hypothetical protein
MWLDLQLQTQPQIDVRYICCIGLMDQRPMDQWTSKQQDWRHGDRDSEHPYHISFEDMHNVRIAIGENTWKENTMVSSADTDME